MLNNDSVISLSRSRVQIESNERIIIFTDIEVYLSKISKKKLIQGSNKNNVFKLAITHSSKNDSRQNFFPVNQVINEINEKLMIKFERTEKAKNAIMNKKSLIYSDLDKADDEVNDSLYNCILNTNGAKVNDFSSLSSDVQLLILANTSRMDLIQKLINHKAKEQK